MKTRSTIMHIYKFKVLKKLMIRIICRMWNIQNRN